MDQTPITGLPPNPGLTGPEMIHVATPGVSDTKVSVNRLAQFVAGLIQVIDPATLAAIQSAVQAGQASLAGTLTVQPAGGALPVSLAGTIPVTVQGLPLPTIGQAALGCRLNILASAAVSGITLPLSVTPGNVCAVANPVGSGRVVYLDSLVLTAGIDYSLARVRLTTIPGGTTITPTGRSGAALATVAKILGSPTFTGGTTELVRRSSNFTFAETWAGALAIQPGQALAWVATPLSGLNAGTAITGEITLWDSPL